MSSPAKDRNRNAGIPFYLIASALVLVGLTVLLSGIASQTGIGRVADTSQHDRVRWLRFETRPDNRLAVIDAGTDQQIDLLPSADEGFIAGALRGLNFERNRHGKSLAEPYRLIARPGAGVALIDPQTGVYVQLEAFGKDNLLALSRYLPPQTNPNPVVRVVDSTRH